MPKQFTERDAIANLQKYLRRLSYLDDDSILSPIDGIFESHTENALRQFQRNNDLSVTGTADRETWDLLYAQYLLELDRLSLPEPLIPFPSYPDYHTEKLGNESFLVSVIQHILVELSFFYDSFGKVRVSGVYDEDTQNAIRDFQTANRLQPTGEADKQTWNALASTYNILLHYIEQR